MDNALQLIALTSLLAFGAGANAQVSAFDVNDEGWTVTSFTNPAAGDFSIVSSSAPTYNSTGGNGSGFISKQDPDTGDFYFIAPSAFLGDKSVATSLSYDLIYNGTVDYQTFDVVLRSASKMLIYRANPDIVPGANWSTVSVSLAPSSSWKNGVGGPLATATDFSDVLGNLTGLYIKGEYTSGVIEITGLDNVNLQPVPEPATLLALGLGVLAIARKRRR